MSQRVWFSFSRSCQSGCIRLNGHLFMCQCARVFVCVCACKAVRSTHYIKTHSSLCGTAGHCWDRMPVSPPILLKLSRDYPWLVTPGERRAERIHCSPECWIQFLLFLTCFLSGCSFVCFTLSKNTIKWGKKGELLWFSVICAPDFVNDVAECALKCLGSLGLSFQIMKGRH